ncbi:MAG: putative metal-binding motif-containing protein [Polyangiaceae bacterium]|nr:putative metal-binding motif-containing protein [Polyangiaceae bacterium]
MCDDGNVCTEDSCKKATGECVFESLVEDSDGDGVVGARSGVSASVAEMCGQDCDDTSRTVHPGQPEVCDGKDNDCNGVVDDGAVFLPSGQAPLLVSVGSERAQASGIGFDGDNFALNYAGKEDSWKIFFQSISFSGQTQSRVPLTSVNADTFGGPLLWTGTEYAVAWEDARLDDNYEIYFNRLDRTGAKFAADLRITRADDFSLHPSIVYGEGEYLIAWDDRRPEVGAGPRAVAIYGQRISKGGELIGGNVRLTPVDSGSEGPSLASGKASVGMVYSSIVGGAPILNFRSLSRDLTQLGTIVDLGFSNVRSTSIVWVEDRFLVFWDAFTDAPGPNIWGAALAEDGRVLVAPRQVTDYGQFARGHSAVSLGDRALLVWSDFRHGNYELSTKQLSTALGALTPESRITTTSSETLNPYAAVGTGGAVGILFEDWQSGSRQAYFTALSCQGARTALP